MKQLLLSNYYDVCIAILASVAILAFVFRRMHTVREDQKYIDRFHFIGHSALSGILLLIILKISPIELSTMCEYSLLWGCSWIQL